jgi:hypothetical protein
VSFLLAYGRPTESERVGARLQRVRASIEGDVRGVARLGRHAGEGWRRYLLDRSQTALASESPGARRSNAVRLPPRRRRGIDIQVTHGSRPIPPPEGPLHARSAAPTGARLLQREPRGSTNRPSGARPGLAPTGVALGRPRALRPRHGSGGVDHPRSRVARRRSSTPSWVAVFVGALPGFSIVRIRGATRWRTGAGPARGADHWRGAHQHRHGSARPEAVRWRRPPCAASTTLPARLQVRQRYPRRKLRRTRRLSLSGFGSSNAIDCQVPSASRPPTTGTVSEGGAMSGRMWSAPWPLEP